jgi:hypothetical protein
MLKRALVASAWVVVPPEVLPVLVEPVCAGVDPEVLPGDVPVPEEESVPPVPVPDVPVDEVPDDELPVDELPDVAPLPGMVLFACGKGEDDAGPVLPFGAVDGVPLDAVASLPPPPPHDASAPHRMTHAKRLLKVACNTIHLEQNIAP